MPVFGTIRRVVRSYKIVVIYVYNGRSFNNADAVNTEIVMNLLLPTVFNGYRCLRPRFFFLIYGTAG